jgi:hypothetical protein
VAETPDGVGAGQAALRRGDWEAAKTSFEEALGTAESADALDGLGQALWWLSDIAAAMDLRERAYVLHVRAGERRRAARIALWLSHEHATTFGNRAAADGWRFRAERLLEGVDEGAEPGWLELARAR